MASEGTFARSIRDIAATSSRTFSLGPRLPRNRYASDRELLEHLDREYRNFRQIQSGMERHEFRRMGYSDGLFVVVCGLLSFGRVEVLPTLPAIVTGDAPYMRRLCILIRGMLKIPDDLDIERNRAHFTDWIDAHSSGLIWVEEAGEYILNS